MSKINQIIDDWPLNAVLTSKWLQERGISRQLADSYVKSGWLERFGNGAYKRTNQQINWFGGLYSLQKVCGLNVHAAGKTALELHGYAHYLRKDARQNVLLWKSPDTRLPVWFVNNEWKEKMHIRSVNLFDEEVIQLTNKEINGITVGVSVAEQAVLEYLYDIPKYESFDEAIYIMEGLVSLRPSVLQTLLEDCRSVKVKRLFLYIAEYYNHPWFKRLDRSKMDLGSGKREIIKGGKLDASYQIVVPEIQREDR